MFDEAYYMLILAYYYGHQYEITCAKDTLSNISIYY